MQKKLFLIIHLCVFTLCARENMAQVSRIANPDYIGARPMAMGETFVGIADDINAIYWNPAGMSSIERYEFQFMRAGLYNSGIKNNYFAALFPAFLFIPNASKLTFGFDWFNQNFDDNELDYSQNKLSFSIAAQLFRYLSVGGKIKYLSFSGSSEDVMQGKGTGWGMDAGLLFSPITSLKFGLVVQDPFDMKIRYRNGTRETLYQRNVRYGMSYEFRDLFFLKSPIIGIDLDDRLHFGAEVWLQNIISLRGGIQKDRSKQGEKDLIYSYGFGLRYKFFQFDYAITNSPFLENSNRFSFALHFNLPPSPIKIRDIQVRDIYASQYIYHETDTCAIVDLICESQRPVTCKVRMKERKYGITAEKTVKFDPGIEKSKQIVLYPNMPDKIMKSSHTDGEWTKAMIKVEPKTVIGSQVEEMQSSEFLIYGMGTINWAYGTEQAAAFITPEDPLVDEIALTAQDFLHNSEDLIMVNENITLAAYLFNLLGKYGIRYKIDPNTPFAERKRELDTIQYPYQLLQKKQGDCDDTTILFASLLENLGIRTALIDVPRHIFLIFDTGIHERHQLKLCLDHSNYLICKQHVWLPVETTMYGQPFWEAWEKGAEEFQKYQAENRLDIIDVHDAWLQHRPLNVKYESQKITIPGNDEIVISYKQDRKLYHEAHDYFLNREFLQPLVKNPKDWKRQNQLAFILYLLGEEDEAIKKYQYLMKKMY